MDPNYGIDASYTPLPVLLDFLKVKELQDADPIILGSLCTWREAGGEGPLGRRGQAHVIHNRSLEPGWWGHDWRGVILRNAMTSHGHRVFQFSCFNANDPNSVRFPNLVSRAWMEIQDIVRAVYGDTDPDITEGANYYHDSSISFPATWGLKEDFINTLNVGRLRFYRYSPILSNHDDVQSAATGES